MTAESPRVALVTGGAQGIGKAIARRLLDDGMAVMIADCDAAANAESETELPAGGGQVAAVTCDVSRETEVEAAIAATVERFGRLDVLVCNAGIGGAGKRVTELTLEQWQQVIGVNLTGCFLCAKHAASHLERTGGSIVNIASTRALQSEPNTEAYSASKGGIVALTHALAVSLGPAIRVNCISPGWIVTRSDARLTAEDHAQHPAGRVGTPEDVAALVAYLCGGEAGFVTGQNFVIDGGMTRRMIYV